MSVTVSEPIWRRIAMARAACGRAGSVTALRPGTRYGDKAQRYSSNHHLGSHRLSPPSLPEKRHRSSSVPKGTTCEPDKLFDFGLHLIRHGHTLGWKVRIANVEFGWTKVRGARQHKCTFGSQPPAPGRRAVAGDETQRARTGFISKGRLERRVPATNPQQLKAPAGWCGSRGPEEVSMKSAHVEIAAAQLH
jgi:hypothetical protein